MTRLLTNDDEPARSHIVPTKFTDLWLLPSGPLPPNPADLLSTGRFQQILGEVTQHFDVVIIDAPPVLGLADSLLLASVAGNLMFVVESGKTRTKAAVEALLQLDDRLLLVALQDLVGELPVAMQGLHRAGVECVTDAERDQRTSLRRTPVPARLPLL